MPRPPNERVIETGESVRAADDARRSNRTPVVTARRGTVDGDREAPGRVAVPESGKGPQAYSTVKTGGKVTERGKCGGRATPAYSIRAVDGGPDLKYTRFPTVAIRFHAVRLHSDIPKLSRKYLRRTSE